MNRSYIINDVNDDIVNAEYPPNKDRYGEEFGGYKNRTERMMFYEFAVKLKDISLIYNGIKYYLYRHNDVVKVYDASNKEDIAEYSNELELIEKFSIDGTPFIELMDKLEDVNTYVDVFTPHLALDEEGYPYNCKYPPNRAKYGDLYNGYRNSIEETLFYDFGVQGYDLYFKYKGKEYYALTEYDHVAVCDENFSKEYETFANSMELIENFEIDGSPIIDLMDKLEDVNPM